MKKKTALLATAALGGLLLASTAGPAHAGENGAEAAKGECWGINSCKGTGACQGKGHSCAGENACKGQGWLKLTAAECAEKSGEFKDD